MSVRVSKLISVAALYVASMAMPVAAANIGPNGIGTTLGAAKQPAGTIRLVVTFSEAVRGDDPTKLARGIAGDYYGTLEMPVVAQTETSFAIFVRPDQLARIELDPRIGRIDGLPPSPPKPQVATTAAQTPTIATRTTSAKSSTTKPSLRRAPNAALDPTPTFNYSYDGSGNIIAITNANNVADTYRYDPVGRLVTATANWNKVSQSYQYDGFGNLTNVT